MVQLDLADSSAIAQKCNDVLVLFGHVDILINNAGISSRGTVLETSSEVDRKVMEVNFFGTIALTKGEWSHDLTDPLHQFFLWLKVYYPTCWSTVEDILWSSVACRERLGYPFDHHVSIPLAY